MKKISLLSIILLSVIIRPVVMAQAGAALSSTSYKILNPSVTSGGGVSTSTGYALLSAAGQVGADTRLESTNYRMRSGFPHTFQAHVPKIACFETTTNGGSTNCLNIPGAAGMIGVCGENGCYDRAKLEIDDQNNPIDTLFLVALSDDSWTTTYYLQSDHSISTSYDINDYMTQCELEGRDSDDSNCDDSGDGNWDEGLQRYNVLSINPNSTYLIQVRAVHGDFTETQYSTTGTATTTVPSISLDLDVAATDSETAYPYSIDLGVLGNTTPTTATDSIWIDIGTNAINGVNVNVRDLNAGLSFASDLIPSETEDMNNDDGDGGYGLKATGTGQTSLGPLMSNSTFNTTGANEVGAMTTSNTQIFYTNTVGSNFGQINAGRGRIRVKAKAFLSLITGNYTDIITFTAIGSW